MARVKMIERYWLDGVAHEPGTVYDLPDWLCANLIARKAAEPAYEKPAAKTHEPDTKTDSPATVSVKSVGRKRTVTEP